jgi:hypothetical protein
MSAARISSHTQELIAENRRLIEEHDRLVDELARLAPSSEPGAVVSAARSRELCWCGHAEHVHHPAGCQSCRMWRQSLSPEHRWRPYSQLPPIPFRAAR